MKLMKIWLPYTTGGSGTDVFTHYLARGLTEAGHEVVVQAFPHRWQYFPWRLKLAHAPLGTDIALANSWNGFAFRRPGLKLVTVEHLFVLDPVLSPYKTAAQAFFHNTLVRYYEWASMRASDAQVAVSEYTANAHHATLGGPLPQVILNGIDTEFFHPSMKERQPLDGRPFRLLFVGNMSRRKGADLIPAIMERLGEGYELYYTSGLRVDDPFKNIPRMYPLGRLNKEQVREEYRKADLLLFPTRLEGLPLVAMEAMACGTPVVASNASSLPEVIEDRINGRLCTKDDAGAFCDALRELKKAPEELNALSKAALDTAIKKFSIDRMVVEYIQLFSELLENRVTHTA